MRRMKFGIWSRRLDLYTKDQHDSSISIRPSFSSQLVPCGRCSEFFQNFLFHVRQSPLVHRYEKIRPKTHLLSDIRHSKMRKPPSCFHPELCLPVRDIYDVGHGALRVPSLRWNGQLLKCTNLDVKKSWMVLSGDFRACAGVGICTRCRRDLTEYYNKE